MRLGAKVRIVLALAAIAWAVGLVFAPSWLFPAGQFICHQRPERSFFRAGQQLPVCARCTGLYIGAAIAAPAALLAATPLLASRARVLLVVSALPTAVTWSLEFSGVMAFSNGARFWAALPLGSVAAWLVLATLSETRTPRAEPARR